MRRHALLAVAVASLLVVAGCAGGQSTGTTTAPRNSTIQVTGSGSADAEPNRAVVDVAVVATAPDVATARQRLAENTSRMRTALERIGVDDDQITTRRYDIDQRRRPPRREGAEPPVEYRAVHDFRVTVTDIDRVGRVIDTAVGNGATEVDNVQFTLSSDRRRELESRARRAAMADARTKARQLAAGANLTVTGVKVIRTTRAGAPRPAGAATATPAPTPTPAPRSDLDAGPVTVVMTVQVVYTAAPADANATAAG